MDPRPWEKSEITERFKALRRKTHFTQSRLGELIGICRQTINEIERGRVMPHEGTWKRFYELESKHCQPPVSPVPHWEDA